jgi:hypothetical protein
MLDNPWRTTGLRVWLDDERVMPTGFDLHVKTGEALTELLRHDHVSHMSLDHDLGQPTTGYDVMNTLERLVMTEPHVVGRPVYILVHSMNPAGALAMTKVANRLYDWWETVGQADAGWVCRHTPYGSDAFNRVVYAT